MIIMLKLVFVGIKFNVVVLVVVLLVLVFFNDCFFFDFSIFKVFVIEKK